LISDIPVSGGIEAAEGVDGEGLDSNTEATAWNLVSGATEACPIGPSEMSAELIGGDDDRSFVEARLFLICKISAGEAHVIAVVVVVLESEDCDAKQQS
jgi:hypothetical protein